MPAHPSHGPWPYRELHQRSQCRRPHASLPHSTTFRGPMRISTDGPRLAARMRFPHHVQRFVAP
eukprot:8858323-Pyramimonas_sp.AAC.1